MMMDIHAILKLLPHRYPIVLIDRVLELEESQRIVALKNVSINEPYFVGHFPDYPVMPGVLVIEAMAQAAAVLSYVSMGRCSNDGLMFFFAGIDNARFKRQVIPGDQLRLEVAQVRSRAGIGKFSGRAMVGDELAAEADLICAYRSVAKGEQA